MNKRIRFVIALAVAGIAATAAQAQSAQKIMVVDIAKVYESHYKTAEQNALLQADQKKASEELQRRAKEIESAGIQASTRILALIAPEDREFFEWLRWLDALKQSLAQKTTFFLDERSPLFEPFVRPPVAATSQPTDGRPGQ